MFQMLTGSEFVLYTYSTTYVITCSMSQVHRAVLHTTWHGLNQSRITIFVGHIIVFISHNRTQSTVYNLHKCHLQIYPIPPYLSFKLCQSSQKNCAENFNKCKGILCWTRQIFSTNCDDFAKLWRINSYEIFKKRSRGDANTARWL